MTSSFFRKQVYFIFGAQTASQLSHRDLEDGLPEWAVAGRSNVGKSSLINALFGQNKLARTSHTPGRTQQINFFLCANQAIMADLPGYGYAKISKQKRTLWDNLMAHYFAQRPCLRLVVLLIDSRHPPKDLDFDMMNYLDMHAVPYICVFTKTDKTPDSELEKRIDSFKAILRDHPAALEEVFAVSAHKKQGLEELRAFIVRTLDINN